MVIALFIFGVFFVPPRLIHINSIICESQFGPCDTKIETGLNLFAGKSLSDAKSESEAYLREQGNIKKYVVRYLLSDKLKVVIIIKKAEFGLEFGQNQIALVDHDGYVLNYQDTTLLPILKTTVASPKVGDKVDISTLDALNLLAHVSDIFAIKEASAKDGAFYTKRPEGQTFIVSLDRDIETSLGAMILINNELNKANNETRMDRGGLGSCLSSCTIDLRYKNPVVKI